MHMALVLWKKTEDIIFSENGNRTKVTLSPASHVILRMKFENIVLRVQPEGILGPNRVGERVKVMKCPKTGEYIMLMHADDMGYKDPYIGLATCKTIAGDYQLQGPLLYKGQPVKRWDFSRYRRKRIFTDSSWPCLSVK